MSYEEKMEKKDNEDWEDYFHRRYGNHIASTIMAAAYSTDREYADAEKSYLNIRKWMLDNGFAHMSTGGGCSAWVNNMYYSDIFITDLDGTNEAIFLSDDCYIGSYAKNGDYHECHKINLHELMKIW